MNPPDSNPFLTSSAGTKALLTLLLLAALISCWIPAIDLWAQTFLKDTIGSNAIIFGTARSLNALISVIQTAEFGIGIASIELGQVLDPVNDIIERFSGLLLVTLTALGISQVLLLLTSAWVFKVLLTLVGLTTIIVIWRPSPYSRLAQVLVRWTAAIMIFRLLIVFQVIAIWLFDYLYFEATGERALTVLESAIRLIESIKDNITNFNLSEFAFGNSNELKSAELDEDIATSIVTLTVGMLFKSIIIPMAVLWACYKGIVRLIAG